MDALKKAGSDASLHLMPFLLDMKSQQTKRNSKEKSVQSTAEGYYKKVCDRKQFSKYYRVRKELDGRNKPAGGRLRRWKMQRVLAKAGYTVYDDNGKAVYTNSRAQASAGVPFSVQVDILDLNIRTGAGTNYAKTEKPQEREYLPLWK